MGLFDQRITVIDEKLKYFEVLSRDMSLELKKGLDKLSTVNESIVLLLNKNDVRMSLLENKDDNHDRNFEELKNLIEKYEHGRITDINRLSGELEITKQKLTDIDKLIYTCMFVLTGLITISGILASAGWFSPEQLKNYDKNIKSVIPVLIWFS